MNSTMAVAMTARQVGTTSSSKPLPQPHAATMNSTMAVAVTARQMNIAARDKRQANPCSRGN